MIIEDKLVKTQIWDTPGESQYKAASGIIYRGAVGAILVYDVTKRKSFENLKYWLKEIDEYTHTVTEPLILLIGNKSDLIEER